MIYTYSGNILIASNPHKRLRHLYGPRMMAQYKGVPLGELSPHVYAIAEQAYSAMMIDEQRQAILVSGESGAGKTESAKMVMQYLANRATSTQPGAITGKAGAINPLAARGGMGAGMSAENAAPIEEQVLESNPLLEAFGNAKTVRNDNSSRFGKFTDIRFDGAGRVSGASISTYLLERSRVVSINSPERSYHIFYQLTAGASDHHRRLLRLEGGAPSFRYLAQSEAFTLNDNDDAANLRSTLDAMAIIGLSEGEREDVLTAVAAVLHLGNVTFVGNSQDEARPSGPAASEALAILSHLLKVNEHLLLTALTTRSIEIMGGERITTRLSPAAAAEARDSLAKNLYARLFDWIVAAVNRKISALGQRTQSHRSIGILDIYGFESFKENSFEQLCINLANERLQQQFNQHVFKGEQEEYAREGIDWSYVEFVDNQECLDLLEGAPNAPALAVFPLIDEACRLPRATYQDLAHTLRTRLVDRPRFSAPKRPPHAFGIDHYAGHVIYSTAALMDKNKDFTVAEQQQLMVSSDSPFIRVLFEEVEAEAQAEATAVVKPRGGKSAFKLVSVGVQFRKQLGGLMGALQQCQPHFIRCIKPNPESRPGSLNPEYALDQLRAGGVLEAVRIACAGFPTRKAFRPFAQRYAILLASGKGTYRPLDPQSLTDDIAADVSRRVLQAVRLKGWQIGKTRVFLRAGQLAQLEGARTQRQLASAIIIQAAFRGRHARRQLMYARQCATRIQAHWRGIVGRRYAQELRRERAAHKIADAWLTFTIRRSFLHLRRNRRATLVQAQVRMWLARNKFRRDTELGRKAAIRAAKLAQRDAAAMVLQKYARRRIAFKKVEARRAEARRWQRLHEQRDALEFEVDRLQNECSIWRQRYEVEANKAAELAATSQRLSTELTAAQLEAQAAQEAAAAANAAASAAATSAASTATELASRPSSRRNSFAEQANYARTAEVEAAQQAAQSALMAEMDLVRRQKVGLEEHSRRLEAQVVELSGLLKNKRGEVDEMLAAAHAKDRENSKLWEQVRAAAEEYHAEFGAKEAAIAALTAEADATKGHMQAEIEKLRTDMEAEVAQVKEAMQRRVEEAVAETSTKASGLRDAREKNVHFSARVVALNSRVAQLSKQLRDSQAREKALTAELEGAKRGGRGHENGLSRPSSGSSTPPRQLREAYSSQGSPYQAPDGLLMPGQLNEYAGLSRENEKAVLLLTSGVVERRLSIINIQHGATPADSIGMPVAAWLLGETLLHWAMRWRSQEVDVAALRVRGSVLQTAEAEGLTYQAYWFSTTLALGAFLKVRSIGKRECSNLFKLGDELIQFGDLHQLLAASVADMLPVNASVLLSEDAKRLARSTGSLARQDSTADASSYEAASAEMAGLAAAKSFEGLMNSPWKELLGSLSNVLETLRGEGAPPPACRAVVHAALRYVDAELLNALMLRRDCCSISAVKALQSGLMDIKAWVAYQGVPLCGEVADAERALAHSSQAVKYLLGGKDDCVRKASKGFDIGHDLRRMCPNLTPPQIYKLTEHHHDDWITGGGGTNTIALLETLKRAADAQYGPGSPNGSLGIMDSSADILSTNQSGRSFDDEDALLLDPLAQFVLPRKLLTDAARFFVQAPRQHASTAPGVSLLDRIEVTCRRNVQLPRGLRDRPEFAFLK
ncbi:hypothetical protein WJX84_008101 [Apatococcus fuscideae]|uniref:Uncharacterized protein n=1 Tax=Apatococcus fuscideae TaxID=2026836 RepID=A0AAW1T8B7_9CHLO